LSTTATAAAAATVLQGNVAMQLRCGLVSDSHFVVNFLISVAEYKILDVVQYFAQI